MGFRFYSGLLVAMMLIMPIGGNTRGISAAQKNAKPDATAKKEASNSGAVLGHTMKDIDGKDVDLSQYQGKVVLMVNVASKCGYTKHYTGLQQLHEKYADKGLVVMGFPCNQFGGQEPGEEEDIKAFCSSKYNVQFPLFSKIEVNGPGAAPLYKHLTSEDAGVKDQGPVKWNFEKFLIGRDGHVLARFRSKVAPESPEMVQAIEAALAQK